MNNIIPINKCLMIKGVKRIVKNNNEVELATFFDTIMKVNVSNLMAQIINFKLNFIIILIGSPKWQSSSAGNHQLGQWSRWSWIGTTRRGLWRTHNPGNQSGTWGSFCCQWISTSPFCCQWISTRHCNTSSHRGKQPEPGCWNVERKKWWISCCPWTSTRHSNISSAKERQKARWNWAKREWWNIARERENWSCHWNSSRCWATTERRLNLWRHQTGLDFRC